MFYYESVIFVNISEFAKKVERILKISLLFSEMNDVPFNKLALDIRDTL